MQLDQASFVLGGDSPRGTSGQGNWGV